MLNGVDAEQNGTDIVIQTLTMSTKQNKKKEILVVL